VVKDLVLQAHYFLAQNCKLLVDSSWIPESFKSGGHFVAPYAESIGGFLGSQAF